MDFSAIPLRSFKLFGARVSQRREIGFKDAAAVDKDREYMQPFGLNLVPPHPHIKSKRIRFACKQ